MRSVAMKPITAITNEPAVIAYPSGVEYMSCGFRMRIARPAAPTGLSEHARKLTASTAYQTGPPAPGASGSVRRGLRFDLRCSAPLRIRCGRSIARPAPILVWLIQPAMWIADASCLKANVTICSATGAGARSEIDGWRRARRRQVAVDEAISKAQVIHEGQPRSSPGARPGYNPVALTGIAGRVLVKEVNWLGDLVISLPALRAIRAAFATSTITVMVKRELAGFFDGMTWVDEVIALQRGARSARAARPA